jgi:DNA-binding transcriptional MerR regulator
MFTVGEFSQMAQVSKRLLRYYDEIGLLKPAQTDKFTNRRYYRAEQLPQLNRILALKDLGLSLDQIQRMVSDHLSSDEIQGMLLLKKTELEQQLQAELQRIRNIESRLQFIRDAENNKPLDVVIKQVPAQPVLSVRTIFPTIEAAMLIFEQIVASLPDRSAYGWFFGVWHGDGLDEDGMDMEMGRILTGKTHAPVVLNDHLGLSVHELPAVETMATFVVKGSTENMHSGYSAIGIWAAANGYRFAGAPREIALQIPAASDNSDGLTEIQFPVESLHQNSNH